MRFGRNPSRPHEFQPSDVAVTVAVTVHIPHQSGYFKQSLDVFRVMLASLQAHTDVPYDLLVFDNDSCAEVRQFLLEQQQAGMIQQLVLSQANEGLLSAFNFMFGAARGKYIAYADCDFYFKPGWLPPHLEILEAFPNVGMVTGVPIRHRNHRATAHTLRWAQTAPGVRLEEGLLIDPAWIEEYCEAYDWQPAKTQNIDRRVTLNGVSAYIGAYHGQFVIPKAAALKVLPLPTHNPLATEELDEVLDAAGYLRLSTTNVHVHHMGNVLAPRWEAEAGRLGVGIQPGLGRRLRPIPNWRYRAVHNRIVRPIVSQMHDRLFEMLNQKAR